MLFSVFAPDDKRIIKNTAIHTNRTINFCIYNSRCADYHAVIRQVSVLRIFSCPGCISQVVLIELIQIIRIWNIAGAHRSILVLYHCVECNRIILHQLHQQEVHGTLLHQQPLFRSKALKNVTIGFGAFIQSSYAAVLVVSFGLIPLAIISSKVKFLDLINGSTLQPELQRLTKLPELSSSVQKGKGRGQTGFA